MNGKKLFRDWSDIELFLAVAEHGTLMAAGAVLKLSQPSVGRRLTAMEERCGAHLFIRDRRRMVLTDAGQAILPAAQRMQKASLSMESALDMQVSGLAGEVIISAAEGLGTDWLAPELVAFRRRHPEITIRVLIDNKKADLLHREADIALRIGRPTEPDLVARKLADLHFGFYIHPDLLPPGLPPEQVEDLANIPWVDLANEQIRSFFPQSSGLAGLGLRTPGFVTNSPAAHIAAVRAGLGFGVLSHRWASMFRGLKRILPHVELPPIELWLVTHEDVRHSARIRALADFIAERVRASRDLFATGIAPAGLDRSIQGPSHAGRAEYMTEA